VETAGAATATVTTTVGTPTVRVDAASRATAEVCSTATTGGGPWSGDAA
jgi:hypothetical protein